MLKGEKQISEVAVVVAALGWGDGPQSPNNISMDGAEFLLKYQVTLLFSVCASVVHSAPFQPWSFNQLWLLSVFIDSSFFSYDFMDSHFYPDFFLDTANVVGSGCT